jgi:hypothetical protein
MNHFFWTHLMRITHGKCCRIDHFRSLEYASFLILVQFDNSTVSRGFDAVRAAKVSVGNPGANDLTGSYLRHALSS